MNEAECPYCGNTQEICHDDGYGMSEDGVYAQECELCTQTFVYTISFSIDYTTRKADCLNGGYHKYRPSITNPVAYTNMRCIDCDDVRDCTDSEMSQIMQKRLAQEGKL